MSTKIKGRRLMVCDCAHSFALDGKALQTALGLEQAPAVHSSLCRAQIGNFEDALQRGEPLLVACTQEAPLFSEVAGEDAPDIIFANIREQAGWSEAKGAAMPKIAALLAEAAHDVRPVKLTSRCSEGVCLVYGAGQQALDIAAKLAPRLSVSLLLSEPDDALPPALATVSVARGRIVSASGALGGFDIVVDGYAALEPSSRGEMIFGVPQNGARSRCDVIFDLSGGAPLFSAASRRDGYFRVDPGSPVVVAEALFAVSDYVGEFEKPLYVSYDADICAHSRNRLTGCTKCLDNCPTGAITSAGDHVAIDPWICGGCGNCAALCPTGAVSYAYPRLEDLIGRCQTLLSTYYLAGGRDAVLLVHDEGHGTPLIAASARFGRGLPAHVLPFTVFSPTELSHVFFAAALAAGANQIIVLASPERRHDLPALTDQAALTNSLVGALGYAGERVRVVVESDPDAVEVLLHGLDRVNGFAPRAFAPIGGPRDIARTVLAKLHDGAPVPQEIVTLPASAPYGRIRVDTEGCTLCLACVSACPANALSDNPDRPELRFTEAACVQCGLCKVTCPEKVITLEPRYHFGPAAMTPALLNAEEPFACIRCGKPFGTRSTVERIIARLKDKHWMFMSEDRLRLIQMCDDCRPIAVAEEGDDPFAMGERPKIRIAEDYRTEEADAKPGKPAKTPDDFIS